jgi:hypothetical protein
MLSAVNRTWVITLCAFVVACSSGGNDQKPDEQLWGPTTTPFDPECVSGCEVIASEDFGHAGSVTVSFNPEVDDPIAKWGDCLESFKACITDGGAALACSEQSACPETCRDDFEAQIDGVSDLAEQLAAFEATYINGDAPCRPTGGEVAP